MNDSSVLRGFSGRARLFPLEGVALFPHIILPLHIFEPRYRAMTEDTLQSDGFLTLVQALGPTSTIAPEPTPPCVSRVGCLGRIVRHERLDDGRFTLLLAGLARVRILEELEVATPYRQARVELNSDVGDWEVPSGEQHDLLDRLQKVAEQPIDDELRSLLGRSRSVGFLCDVLSHVFDLSTARKQQLLEESNVRARLRLLEELLRAEASERWDSNRDARSSPPFSLN